MKKIALLVLALVVALGALGVGYAAWTDDVTISGSVATGELDLCIKPGTITEVGGCPDKNWHGWIQSPGEESCPPGYAFDQIFLAPEGKCPATVSFTEILDAEGKIQGYTVTINDAYPYFLADISFYVCNCGTIPLKIQAPVISQNPSLVIQYGDNIGRQLHRGQCVEISYMVGVTQHEGYFNGQGVWIVDDVNAPLTPMNTPLSFTIMLSGIQWNEG